LGSGVLGFWLRGPRLSIVCQSSIIQTKPLLRRYPISLRKEMAHLVSVEGLKSGQIYRPTETATPHN
jgi:hypothetical protein